MFSRFDTMPEVWGTVRQLQASGSCNQSRRLGLEARPRDLILIVWRGRKTLHNPINPISISCRSQNWRSRSRGKIWEGLVSVSSRTNFQTYRSLLGLKRKGLVYIPDCYGSVLLSV